MVVMVMAAVPVLPITLFQCPPGTAQGLLQGLMGLLQGGNRPRKHSCQIRIMIVQFL